LSIAYISNVCKVPTEVIVVDFQSTDDTPKIARKYGAKIIEVDKAGVGYATYVGVAEASGDIIVRTDADTIITPSAMWSLLKGFNNPLKKLA